MGRAKIPMELITDNKKRSITFQRRKTGIIKKAFELTTLCDVNVCMIICLDRQESEVFPQNPKLFNTLIDLYDQNRRMRSGKVKRFDLSEYFKDRKIKIEEELVRAKKKNMDAKYPSWFEFLNSFSEGDLREFASRLGNKIDQVKTLVESHKGMNKIVNLDLPWRNPGDFLDLPWLNPNPGPMTMLMMMPSDCGNVYNNFSFDPNNLIMKSSNPNSIMKTVMNEDNHCYDSSDGSSLPFMHMQPCLVPGFPSQVHGSQVMEYKNGANGIGYYN